MTNLKICIVALIVTITSCAPATQGYFNPKYRDTGAMRIAVLPVASTGEIQLSIGQGGIENTIVDQLTLELLRSGKFQIFERSNLTQLLNEQNLSISSRTETEVRRSLGKVANLDALLLVSSSRYGGAYGTTDVNLNARLVDLQSGEIIYMGNAKSDYAVVVLGTTGEAINVVVSSIVNDMVEQFHVKTSAPRKSSGGGGREF